MTQFFKFLVGLWLLSGVALTLAGLLTPAQSADVAIVLGNTVYRDGSPSPRLAARLDSAIQCYRQKQCGLVFVSGGIDAAGTDEAAAMRTYLMRHGVAEDRIAVDSNGVDTWSTAHHASTFMRDRGLSKALVVTQYFHLPRVMLALSRFGVRDISGTYPRFWESRDFYSIAREVPAFVWYVVRPRH
ncbi:YdcF family protein [Pandoraea sp. NPDC087047]|uniref:YdcF family protein n=1 Tax=Pandoraea sp. NPDC087047 TaxID=3364390 RepID=UPI00382D69FE